MKLLQKSILRHDFSYIFIFSNFTRFRCILYTRRRRRWWRKLLKTFMHVHRSHVTYTLQTVRGASSANREYTPRKSENFSTYELGFLLSAHRSRTRYIWFYKKIISFPPYIILSVSSQKPCFSHRLFISIHSDKLTFHFALYFLVVVL